MDLNYFRLCQLSAEVEEFQYYDIEQYRIFLEKSGLKLNYQIPHDSSTLQYMSNCLGYTALHFAAESQNYLFVSLLLFYGADFTSKSYEGFTPLMLIVNRYKNKDENETKLMDIKVVDLLLSAHLESKNSTNPKCNNGMSHFHIACMANKVLVVDYFLKSGVDVNEAVNLESPLFPGFTPLHFAVLYGNLDIVEMLMTHNADMNRLDGNGFTPLRLLVARNIEINNDIFIRIIDVGDEYYAYEIAENKLVINDSIICMFMRVMNMNSPNAIDDIGLSLFHVSCTRKDTSVVKNLSKLDANLDAAVNFDSPAWPGFTPLHFAACCNLETFMLLMNRGADISAKDAKGVTPFDLCVQRYTLPQIGCILEKHPYLKLLSFQNGATLTSAFDKVHENAKPLPLDSDLCPGYTPEHLAVALSKLTYPLRRNYCVQKNDDRFRDEHSVYGGGADDDSLINKCLVNKPRTLTTQDARGMTPLHLAFHTRKKCVVERIASSLLELGELENSVDQRGLSHLQIACIVDNVELVREFLRRGCDGNAATRSDLVWYHPSDNTSMFGWSSGPLLTLYKAGWTLYHIAAANDSEGMMKALAEFGATPDATDPEALDAVHVGFLKSGSRRALRTLLSIVAGARGGSINRTTGSGLSRLHVACYAHDRETLKELLGSVAASDLERSIDCAKATGAWYADNLAPYAGYTPLHVAVCESDGEADIVDLLITKGANVRAKNAAGLDSLHLALQCSLEGNVIERLCLELTGGREWRDDFGLTRLHLACAVGDTEAMKCLLEAGENVNEQIHADSPIWPGNTALHILANSFANSLEPIQLLLKHGADLTLKNSDNNTPLHLMWENRDSNTSYVSRLIEQITLQSNPAFYGINPINSDGVSHFHISCASCNSNVVKNFIDSGVDVNQPVNPFTYESFHGFTPLHFAITYHNVEVIELLLRNGANLNLEDVTGVTPIQLAIKNLAMMNIILSNAEVDVQVENVFGKTVLELMLDAVNPNPGCHLLANSQIRINFIDPPAKKTNIAKAASKLDHGIFRNLIEKATDLTNVDADGRNALHYIASYNMSSSSHQELTDVALNIMQLLDMGCDLDRKDKEGRTPLNYAIETADKTSDTFLLLGADVNACLYEPNLDSYKIRLRIQISMMYYAGLHLTDSNKNIVIKDGYFSIKCNALINRMAKKMVTEDLSIRDLGTEWFVRSFPRMPLSKRKDIIKFLDLVNVSKECADYDIFANILQYQRRRILRRTELLEPAKVLFHNHIVQLPWLCIDSILDNLSNYDLESLLKI